MLVYLISPFIAATIPLYDGKKWDTWKDVTTTKIVSVIGNIISMMLYLYLINFLSSILFSTNNYNIVTSIIFLFVAISGVFVAAKVSILIASIISHS